jgi:hypothetical protein
MPASVAINATTLGLIASLSSLVLAVILGVLSIWLSLHFKREADEVNKRTLDLLVEVRTDAKAIVNYALPELRAWGETGRQAFMLGQTKTGLFKGPAQSGSAEESGGDAPIQK